MKNITLILLLFVSLLNASCTFNQSDNSEHFSFHLLSEPTDLDPAHFRGSSGSYLFNNLFRGLYSYTNQKLNPENVKSCKWVNSITLSCTLLARKWSNGKVITANDYIKNFQRFFMKNIKTYQTEHLLNIKNAKEILSGSLPIDKLGVKSLKPGNILFQLVKPDSNFLYTLASPSFGPIYLKNNYAISQSSNLVTNGPYTVKEWNKGSFVILEPNKFYDNKWKERPKVKIYFLENDETALTLFETGKMNFLRRLLTSNIQRYKNSSKLILKPILRFDYIGLTNEILPHKSLKKALTSSLNFIELQKIYQGKGTPGCPGLPSGFQTKIHCHKFDLQKAKQYLSQVPQNIKEQRWTLYYSKMGGKDIKKGMEWVQNQWTKNLGLKINLQAVEQGMYLSTLRGQSVDLFRKGVGVDHPTCLAALKVFGQSSGENYIKFKNAEYEALLEKLTNTKLYPSQEKELCSRGVQILIDSHQWIPMGEIHFAMLDDQKFTGFEVNYLNQLDLTHLRKR